MIPAAAHFFTGVSSAIVMKLASSIDDVLWLSAFLTPSHSRRERSLNIIMYGSVCLFQTTLAYVLSTFGSSVLDEILGGSDDERMSTDRLLTLISGAALFIYAIVLGLEMYQDRFGVDYSAVERNRSFDSSEGSLEEAKMEEGRGRSPVRKEGLRKRSASSDQLDDSDVEPEEGEVGMTVVPLEIEKETEEPATEGVVMDDGIAKKSRSLIIIAFLGSLDDLTLFVPMLVGKALTILELVIGAMTAVMLIVTFCLFLTQCKRLATVLEQIPLVAIVAVFSVGLLVKGIFFMD